MKENEVVVIYHANCTDGMTAAGIAKYFLEKNSLLKNIEFYPGRYSETPPVYENKTIFFVDFSYKRESIQTLLDLGNRVVIIDHHKSMIEDLQPLKDDPRIQLFVSENNTQSGTGLAWEFFALTTDMPEPFQYVQDRDLWTWKFQNSRPFLASLDLMERRFETYAEWVKDVIEHDDIQSYVQEHVNVGNHLTKYNNSLCGDIIRCGLMTMDLLGFKDVPVLNCPGVFMSDVGNKVMLSNDEYPFVLMWERLPKGLKIGLRSLADREDVSKIAQAISPEGGGHYAASGAIILNKDLPTNPIANLLLN